MKYPIVPMLFVVTSLSVVSSGCGSSTAGSNTIYAAPLSGPNAASLSLQGRMLALADSLVNFLGEGLLGLHPAVAGVPSFTSFKACNDTLVFINSKGEKLNINGSQNPSVGQGLLTFSSSGTDLMTIGSVNIPDGTVLSEVDITFAVKPSVCAGAVYAIQFDSGLGPVNITQNTAFKFLFPAGKTVAANDSVTLMFGQIVNGMVTKGAALDNSTIQTVNVGLAK